MTNSSNVDRRRPGQTPRRTLVRSNSSLLGSFKNFVAAPFARLFTGNANEFDDPNDFSGKRRMLVNQHVDNNDIVEDGPAPAKRMRVRSPEPLSPPPRSGYLDSPGSAFQVNNNIYNSSSNPPSRSASLSNPSTTLPESTYNARSTISPLRKHFSRNMSIDVIPSAQSRPLTRDISMKSISSVPSSSLRLGSRDSLPPMGTHPFRMRESLTPQPHKLSPREASEPPPVTALRSNPVFVRGPSQVSESQTRQPVATLGSLVDSQRISRSPSKQRTLLFGSSQSPTDLHGVAAERTLHELDFYKTPLVPTRIRSKMSSKFGASSSTITDMFSRRNSLILMGDHDRPGKGSKRNNKSKGKGKEANETKPYAGTTGIKKRLAKVKVVTQQEETTDHTPHERVDKAIDASSSTVAAEIPLPPPKEKDFFNVAAFPSSTAPSQQSSLRVGRAARSHLSRPIKKFSAAYDDDDDKVSDEAKNDMEMLAEAAQKVPAFEIPAGFTFAAKDSTPIEPASSATKEPPIASLPFSLTPTSALSAAATTVSEVQQLPASALFDAPSGTGSSSSEGAMSGSADTSNIGKVPNFFAASKTLSQGPSTPVAVPTLPALAPPFTPAPASTANSAFLFAPSPAPTATEENKTEKEVKKSTLFTLPATGAAFDFGGPSVIQQVSAPTAENPKPSFDAPSQMTPAASQPPSFSLTKPAEVAQSTAGSGSSSGFTFGTSTTARSGDTTDRTHQAASFSFSPAPSTSAPSSDLFGASNNGANPASLSQFGSSSDMAKPVGSSPFNGSSGSTKPAGASLFSTSNESAKPAGSPFSFSQSSHSTSLFGSQTQTESTSSFGEGSNHSVSSPFSFAPPTSGAAEQPKSLFGAPTMNDDRKATGFSFGSSSAPSTSAGITSFSFGAGTSSSNNTPTPFSFGASVARPVTPPNQDQEVRMDESPTRDVSKPTEPRPSLNGFSFTSAPTSSTASSLFGPTNGTSGSTGFSFGQSAGASNPFGGMKADDKQAVNKPFESMGQSQATSSPFSFGRAVENEPPRPSTTGSFSFGSSSSSSTGPGPTFSFGAPSNNPAPSNPFGGSQNGSAPNSPSTFGPTSSFAFGPSSTPAPVMGGSNSFMFSGSQPASPATPNTGLPSSGFGSANPFGAPSSSSGFGTPAPPPSSGGSLFTIGAAPSDSGRQIKKLPTRKKR
ncbi:hypothetical protein BDP27DRAFT_1420076 [Rhodocollybia butyracea]|uniref:Uncharacterized protein n=1 Tax=Rhodocollybia butyracea TaxID=206335 RepID=A0A9P5PYA5_9AGAR|nr:hypothetical protein BDP27DRAFT_1420076 [Rhodocollybia butyracea]